MPYSRTISNVAAALSEVFSGLEQCFDIPRNERLRRPADGGWTIDEILEHVTLVNHYLLLVIRKGCAKAVKRSRHQPVGDGESDLDELACIADPDAFVWRAPDHMLPGGLRTPEEVHELMLEQKDECLALLDAMGKGEGSLCSVRMSVRNLGKLDMYQWLYFLAMHARRHLRQIEENVRVS